MGRGRAPWAIALLGLLLAGNLPLEVAPRAAAEHAPEVVARLPLPASRLAAVWNGTHALLFGGYGPQGYLDSIWAFDPATGEVEVKQAVLPSRRAGMAAVWDGRYAYLFGGYRDDTVVLDEIVRYDPVTDNVTLLPARLPFPLAYAAAVWNGTFAYIFGGQAGNGGPLRAMPTSSSIVRFDPAAPASQQVRVSSTQLPGPGGRAAPVAVWDGEQVWVFGGVYEYVYGACGCVQGASHADLVRYDPRNNTVASIGAPPLNIPPFAMWAAPGFHDGRHVFVVGGNGVNSVVRFDPRDMAYSTAPNLPRTTGYPAAVWTGSAAYAFGGETGSFVDLHDDVLLLSRSPAASFAPVPPTECIDGKGTFALDASGSRSLLGQPLAFAWAASSPTGTLFTAPSAVRTNVTTFRGSDLVTLGVAETYFDGQAVSHMSRLISVVDTLPPVTNHTLTGTPGANGWFTSPQVEVALQGWDLCDLERVVVSVDGGSWDIYVGPRTIEGEGRHTVSFYAQDRAGFQEATRTVEVNIDSIAPTVNRSRPEAGHLYVADQDLHQGLPETVVVHDVRVHGDGADGGSGLERLELMVDGEVRGAFANGTFLWRAGAEAAGRHALAVRAVDVAGNAAGVDLGVLTVPTGLDGALATSGLARCRELFTPPVCAAAADADVPALVALLRSLAPSPEETCRGLTPLAVCDVLGGAT